MGPKYKRKNDATWIPLVTTDLYCPIEENKCSVENPRVHCPSLFLQEDGGAARDDGVICVATVGAHLALGVNHIRRLHCTEEEEGQVVKLQ